MLPVREDRNAEGVAPKAPAIELIKWQAVVDLGPMSLIEELSNWTSGGWHDFERRSAALRTSSSLLLLIVIAVSYTHLTLPTILRV